jgi:hypothetical protein
MKTQGGKGMRGLLLGALVVATAFVATGNAWAQVCDGTVVSVGPFYVDVRNAPSVDERDTRIYEESNGIAALQRGGVGLISDDSSCAEFDSEGNQVPPDTLIF